MGLAAAETVLLLLVVSLLTQRPTRAQEPPRSEEASAPVTATAMAAQLERCIERTGELDQRLRDASERCSQVRPPCERDELGSPQSPLFTARFAIRDRYRIDGEDLGLDQLQARFAGPIAAAEQLWCLPVVRLTAPGSVAYGDVQRSVRRLRRYFAVQERIE